MSPERFGRGLDEFRRPSMAHWACHCEAQALHLRVHLIVRISLSRSGIALRQLCGIEVELKSAMLFKPVMASRDKSFFCPFTRSLVLSAAFAAAMQLAIAPAQATDEIQVYNAEIAPVHTWYLQQHLNYVWQGGTAPDFDGGFASYHTLNGTPELAYGVTDWYEMGWYVPFSVDSNGTFLPGGFKFRHLFVSPHAAERHFFYGLNIELSYQSPRFSPNPFMVEFRPIIGVRDMGWEFIANPIVDVSAGPTGTAEFAPALRLAHALAEDVWVGAEYYANVGPLGNFSPTDTQQHNLFGVVDFRVLGFDVELGAGAGLTSGSDGLVTKLIIGHAL